MATVASLRLSGLLRTTTAAAKNFGAALKFREGKGDPIGGFDSLDPIVFRPPSGPAGFPPPIPGPTRPSIPPFLPQLPTIPTFGPFDFPPIVPPGTGGGADLCAFLPESLREICRAATKVIGGTGGGGTTPLVPPSGGCSPGFIKVGGLCIDPSAMLPGGDPGIALPTLPGGGGVVQGGFGLPAAQPSGVSRIVRKCARGMVLGIDNLCYAKAILPPRSKLRKWRRPPRPPISRRDVVAIRRAGGARDRVAELAKDVGLKVTHRKKRK